MKVAAEACDLLKAVANPHRLVMLCQLVDSEKSVGQLAASLNIRDSAASQNLSLMRKQGIVAARRDGQIMWYSIASAEIRAILEVLYGIYCVERPLCESVPSSRKPRKTSNKRKSR
ncbi:MAG: winged helix-turn-helix transcriptional regulator [Alphaproteobacteria bacterium]|nr:winged helix-turn-helix transcriptional regulator [Alphaproteobacteria bacterium]